MRFRLPGQRWMALVLMWIGVLWLLQSELASFGGEYGVRVFPQRVDWGSIEAGRRYTQAVTILNLSGRSVEVVVEPSCGCTVADLSRARLLPLGWYRFRVEVDTSGMGSGVHGRVVRLRFMAGDRVWHEDVLFRFSVKAKGQ